MDTDPGVAPLVHLLHAGDSTFPTGAYAHSFGLEGLVELGIVTDAESLGRLLSELTLPQLAQCDLPWVFHAHAAAVVADVELIAAHDRVCHAQRATRELREASTRIGAQRLRLAAMLDPKPLLDGLLARLEAGRLRGSAPVVHGVVCACAGADAAAAAASYAYQALAGQVAAGVKLLRLGQNAAQRVLAEALRRVPDAVARSGKVSRDDIGVFAPLVEIASARHETADARLFIS